jgi:hypothetical protein
MSLTIPTTLFKAIKAPNGKIVCIHSDHLEATCRVARTLRDYEVMIGQGWCDDPQEAMRRKEASEDDIANQAAVAASDDKSMSQAAQDEVISYGSTTLEHVLEIPEAPRKRGRPRKVQ